MGEWKCCRDAADAAAGGSGSGLSVMFDGKERTDSFE
jgi:hypothetical protein